jgi:hypothetical protein
MEKLTNFKVDPKRFEILKENVSIENVAILCFVYLQEPVGDL